MMDSHTILLMLVLNMMFLYMYVYVAGQFCRCTITDTNCIFRNIAESPTVAPDPFKSVTFFMADVNMLANKNVMTGLGNLGLASFIVSCK